MLEYLIYGVIGWFTTVGLTKLFNRGSFNFSTKSKSGNTELNVGYNQVSNKQKEPSDKTEDSNRDK